MDGACQFPQSCFPVALLREGDSIARKVLPLYKENIYYTGLNRNVYCHLV